MERRDFVRTAAAATGGLAVTGRLGAATPGTALTNRENGKRAAPPAVDPATRELLMEALDAARSAGAEYADARVMLRRDQRVGTREEQITGVG